MEMKTCEQYVLNEVERLSNEVEDAQGQIARLSEQLRCSFPLDPSISLDAQRAVLEAGIEAVLDRCTAPLSFQKGVDDYEGWADRVILKFMLPCGVTVDDFKAIYDRQLRSMYREIRDGDE